MVIDPIPVPRDIFLYAKLLLDISVRESEYSSASIRMRGIGIL